MFHSHQASGPFKILSSGRLTRIHPFPQLRGGLRPRRILCIARGGEVGSDARHRLLVLVAQRAFLGDWLLRRKAFQKTVRTRTASEEEGTCASTKR